MGPSEQRFLGVDATAVGLHGHDLGFIGIHVDEHGREPPSAGTERLVASFLSGQLALARTALPSFRSVHDDNHLRWLLTGGGATLQVGVASQAEAASKPSVAFWAERWTADDLSLVNVAPGDPAGQARLEASTLLASVATWRPLVAASQGL